MTKNGDMLKGIAETRYSVLKEIQDIDKILKFGNCSESHRKYLRKRKEELEKKLRDYEGVSD